MSYEGSGSYSSSYDSETNTYVEVYRSPTSSDGSSSAYGSVRDDSDGSKSYFTSYTESSYSGK